MKTTTVYPFTLRFVKRITQGPLNGLEFAETLGFVSKESAQSWIDGVQEYAVRNGWKLVAHTLEDFDPSNEAHNLSGETFHFDHTPEIVWTVLHYHRGNAWVCKESLHGTTCEFYANDILSML